MKTLSTFHVGALSFIVAALFASIANARYDAFLKIEGPDVKGESRAEGHEDSIEIFSYSWGVVNHDAMEQHGIGPPRGGGAGKVSLSTLTVKKKSDRSSPALFRDAVMGVERATEDGEFPIRLIMVYTPDGDSEPVEMFSVELNQSQIAELHSTVVPAKRGGGDDSPMETVSFTFGKVRMNVSSTSGDSYDPLAPDDTVEIDNPAFDEDR